MTSPANTSDRETGTVERLVAVKPLEWRQSSDGEWRADHYRIRCDIADEPPLWIVSGWSSGTNPYETLDAAKAAAQSDYTRRILSALDLSELTRLKARADAAEAERVEEWNRRREADGSRDAARAACDTMRHERDEAEAKLATAREAAASVIEIADEAAAFVIPSRKARAWALACDKLRAALRSITEGADHERS